MNKSHDKIFRRILSILVFIVMFLSFFYPLLISHDLSDGAKIGLSLLQDTTVFWCTAILGFYFGANLIKSFINNSRLSDINSESTKSGDN